MCVCLYVSICQAIYLSIYVFYIWGCTPVFVWMRGSSNVSIIYGCHVGKCASIIADGISVEYMGLFCRHIFSNVLLVSLKFFWMSHLASHFLVFRSILHISHALYFISSSISNGYRNLVFHAVIIGSYNSQNDTSYIVVILWRSLAFQST